MFVRTKYARGIMAEMAENAENAEMAETLNFRSEISGKIPSYGTNF